jgi:hypothetical protein
MRWPKRGAAGTIKTEYDDLRVSSAGVGPVSLRRGVGDWGFSVAKGGRLKL